MSKRRNERRKFERQAINHANQAHKMAKMLKAAGEDIHSVYRYLTQKMNIDQVAAAKVAGEIFGVTKKED